MPIVTADEATALFQRNPGSHRLFYLFGENQEIKRPSVRSHMQCLNKISLKTPTGIKNTVSAVQSGVYGFIWRSRIVAWKFSF